MTMLNAFATVDRGLALNTEIFVSKGLETLLRTMTGILKNGVKEKLKVNKKNTWEMVVNGGKFILFTVGITGRILKEVILESIRNRR